MAFVPHINTTFPLGKCQLAGGAGFFRKSIVMMLSPSSTKSGVMTIPNNELIQTSAM